MSHGVKHNRRNVVIYAKENYEIVQTRYCTPVDYSVTLWSTFLCNYTCEYCDWKGNDHFTLEQNKKVIDVFFAFFKKQNFKKVLFYFLGGEPSLHPHIIDILEYIRQYEKDTGISTTLEFQTNLSFEKERYIKIGDLVDFFDITFHYEEIVLKRDDFSNFYDKVKCISDRNQIYSLDVMLENIPEESIAHFYELVNKLDPFFGDYTELILNCYDYKYGDDTRKKHLDFYNKHNRFESLYKVDGKTYNTNELNHQGLNLKGWKCEVGKRSVYVTGHGNLYLCCHNAYNFREKPFFNIIDDSKGVEKLSILKKMDIKCPFDICFGDYYTNKYKNS